MSHERFTQSLECQSANTEITVLPVICFRVSELIFMYVKQLDKNSNLHYFSKLTNGWHHMEFIDMGLNICFTQYGDNTPFLFEDVLTYYIYVNYIYIISFRNLHNQGYGSSSHFVTRERMVNLSRIMYLKEILELSSTFLFQILNPETQRLRVTQREHLQQIFVISFV